MLVTAFLFAGLRGAVGADAPDAKAIMEKVEEVGRVQTAQVTTLLKTSGGGKAEKVKKFVSWRKLKDDQIYYKTLTKFSSPADISGLAILVLEEKENQNDINMYLPEFKKIRRVEGAQQSGSFMGTVFSYADIATFHAANYRFQYLGNEPCPKDPKHSCHLIQLEPVSEEMRVRTGYSKIKDWVRTDHTVVVQSDCYDLKGKLSKRISSSDIRSVDAKNGKWVAFKTSAVTADSKRTSHLIYTDFKTGVDVPESMLTRASLGR